VPQDPRTCARASPCLVDMPRFIGMMSCNRFPTSDGYATSNRLFGPLRPRFRA
jgi:hypothetical protein